MICYTYKIVKGNEKMGVQELNREQMICLKQSILCDRDATTDWLSLAQADNIVSDEEVYNEYGSVIFTEDDFY